MEVANFLARRILIKAAKQLELSYLILLHFRQTNIEDKQTKSAKQIFVYFSTFPPWLDANVTASTTKPTFHCCNLNSPNLRDASNVTLFVVFWCTWCLERGKRNVEIADLAHSFETIAGLEGQFAQEHNPR